MKPFPWNVGNEPSSTPLLGFQGSRGSRRIKKRSPIHFSLFLLYTLSAKKTETMCMPPPHTPRTMVRIEAAGQIYKQVQSFTYLGGAVTETPDMSVEIARRTRACWMCIIRRYSRELYGQRKVSLSLKTRMVKAEAIGALQCGCSTWTLRQEHYAKLRTVHHRVLLRIIGAQRKRPDHRMTSYNRALTITRCESIETTLRTRRLL